MYTVIVVDDEKSIRERLVSFLEKEDSGFRLLGSYENGYDALMYGVPQEPDLIVTDVKMPFVDGLELIKRAKEELPVVQSIIISGFDSFDYAKRAIELGVVGYISKPIDFDEVRACMEKVKASLDSYFKKEEPKTRESESIEVNLQKLLTMKNIDASFAKKLEEEGMPLKGNVAIVATFAPDSDEEESTYEDEEAMSKEISRLLEEEFADWRTYSFRLPPEKTVLFIQDGEYDCDDYVDRISRVLGRLKKSLGFTVSVGVSEAAYFNEPFSYRRLYRHSRRSLEYRSVMGKGIALYYEDLQKQPSPVGKVDENEYRKLTALVFEGKEDEIKEVLSSFVRRLFLPDFRESYYLILGNVVDSLLRGCLAIEKFYDGYMTHMEMNQRLYDCKDAACLLDKLELIMKRVLEINLEKRRGVSTLPTGPSSTTLRRSSATVAFRFPMSPRPSAIPFLTSVPSSNVTGHRLPKPSPRGGWKKPRNCFAKPANR